MSDRAGQELIIIKRVEEEEHEAHSSAWKVAHADFMTAMMAFFLIMWLINVTDQDVRKAIAHYFNPVNLADNLSPRRGLGEPDELKDEGTSDIGEQQSALKNTVGPRYGQGEDIQQGARERALFQDPYATLAVIAAAADPKSGATSEARAATATGVNAGEAMVDGSGKGEVNRDPFDPAYWQTAVATKPVSEQHGTRQNALYPASGNLPDVSNVRTDLPGKDQAGVLPAGQPGKGGKADKPADANSGATAGAAAQAKPGQSAQMQAAQVQAQATQAQAQAQAAQAQSVEAQINEAVRANMGTLGAPNVEVRATKEGLVVNLTDDTNFSMFAVGSAVPDGRLVRVMERVGQILAGRPGEVVVRGFTDGRPFRSDTYDNWRLSMARAHITYYMLARGGLDEKRFVKIEGFADRGLKNTSDPNAPENRRIEILLREPSK
ncbi:MotB family protein [Aquabacter cavernae]|uniref:MotB family protein n=1 Tax=Aquabacter cavernae TaxID=2496029 RepID=UPI000F8CD87E|nr:MotB family protein [Aquabacter cavernae]